MDGESLKAIMKTVTNKKNQKKKEGTESEREGKYMLYKEMEGNILWYTTSVCLNVSHIKIRWGNSKKVSEMHVKIPVNYNLFSTAMACEHDQSETIIV